MGTRILQVAIIVTAWFCVSPLQACQPELSGNFVFDLEDGVHVFVKKAYPMETFGYPVSGVYRKGPANELIWEYHGIFGGANLKESISANGRYFVETNFVIMEEAYSPDFSPDQSVVLSIYDRGNPIGEFSLDTFISKASLSEHISRLESSGYIFMCEPRRWGHMKYDKLTDQIRIRSAAKRTVVIDVPTAQIAYIDEY